MKRAKRRPHAQESYEDCHLTGNTFIDRPLTVGRINTRGFALFVNGTVTFRHSPRTSGPIAPGSIALVSDPMPANPLAVLFPQLQR